MAIGESRHEAKRTARDTARAAGEEIPWSFSTGKIHSYKTRTTYQEHILRFVGWARNTEGMKDLAALDGRADELASRYLQKELDAHKSPYTLQTIRSALRLFFADRSLAGDIPIPKRLREHITRSRGPAARDRHFQPANWPAFLQFERAVGLRRDELARLKVADVYHRVDGQLVAHVRRGKGGKEREAPALAGREQDVLAVIQGRIPDELVFRKLPDTDIHALRREYAQALYQQYAPGRGLLPTGRLRSSDYDREAALAVSRALGHNRLDVVLRNYLR